MSSDNAAGARDVPRLEFRNIGKAFDSGKSAQVPALSDLSMEIDANEFVCVLGPSGCGKSTLLKIAAGLEEPTSGEALVDGRPVHGPSAERGVIFQQYALFPWLTVRKNVEFGLRIQRKPAKERREIAEGYLRMVGLLEFADMLPKTLSGGMKQRCAVARAYAADPTILLMDEPFGALDALTRVQAQEDLLATWTNHKKTVMFITHDVDEAVFLADRVVVMGSRPGRIVRTIDVGLPRPRTEEIRFGADFSAIRADLWHAVYHETRSENHR
jgi:NitT/TauT family transport system ATP-binding protein